MICPNCGANLPENARFCGQCGSTIEAAAAPQPAYQQPEFQMPEMAWTQPVQQPAAQTDVSYQQPTYKSTGPAKRGNLVTAIIRPQTRVLAIISAVAFLLCIGLTVYGYFLMKNTALPDMPIYSILEDVSGEDLDIESMLEEAGFDEADVDVYFDQARDALDETEMSSKDRKEVEALLNSVEDLVHTPSLGNLQATVNSMDKTMDILEDVQDDLEKQLYMGTASLETQENCRAALDALDDVMEAYDEISEVSDVVNIIDSVFFGLLGFALIVILLAGFFRLPGLLIMTILLYCPFVTVLGSTAVGGALVIAQILLWVMLALVNSRHRATRYE